MGTARPRTSTIVPAASIAAALLCAGCAGIPQAPFTAFAESTALLGDSTEKVIAGLQARVQERYVEQSVADPGSLDGLRLNQLADSSPELAEGAPAPAGARVDGESPPVREHELAVAREKRQFAFDSNKAPLFVQTLRFGAGLRSFNRGIQDYADGLVAMTAEDVIDEAGLDELAANANANLRSARDTLKLDDVENDDLALFTTGGTEAFRAYLQSRRRSDLIDAMTHAQESMSAVSQAGREACTIIAIAMWNEYDHQFSKLMRRATGAVRPGEEAPSGEQKKKAIEEITLLNSNHAVTLSALDAIHESYRKLEGAHAELLRGVKNGALSLEGFAGFLGEVKRIDSLYEGLKGSEGGGDA